MQKLPTTDVLGADKNLLPMLLDTMSCEVEPVPGHAGWFQLTGGNIVRAVSFGEFLEGCAVGMDRPVPNAKVLGIHDQPAVLADDPRFNGTDPGSFVVVERADGGFAMVLEVHMVEAVLFRFLTPATRPALDDPAPRLETTCADATRLAAEDFGEGGDPLGRAVE